MRFSLLKTALKISAYIAFIGVLYGFGIFYVGLDEFYGNFARYEEIESLLVASVCLVVSGGLVFLTVGLCLYLTRLEELKFSRAKASPIKGGESSVAHNAPQR